MSNHVHPLPLQTKFFTTGTKIIFAIMSIGLLTYAYRLLVGLGAVTNLDNQYPWGLWISIDVVCGVALAAGGFTTAAIAEIFHRDKYHIIVRPALLTAMLGYTFVAIGIVADLGRWYNIWHPMLPSMWQVNSALFEVAVCVMLYLTVLYIEFLPVVVERFKGRVKLPKPLSVFNKLIELFLTVADKTLHNFIWIFAIAGVVLSCAHQSSLGTLMVLAQTKMHPLWWSQWSPLMFLLTAIAVGYPMVIFESLIASHSFKLKPEMGVLSSLARLTPGLLTIYLILKILDLTHRGAWSYVFEGSIYSLLYILEMSGGVILPIILLSIPKVRNSVKGLFTSATIVILGLVFNRINVFLVAYQPLYSEKSYFPSVFEFAVTIGLISTLVLIYRFIVIHLPVITPEYLETGRQPTETKATTA